MGPGGGTNPEELLTSAISGCYSITFGIIAANRKLPVTHVETKAVGVVEQNGANFVYQSITLRPTITVTADATDEQVQQTEEFAHKADNYCIVTNAVRGKVAIAIEPTIVRG
jgi:peroxiredoxin-like protein